MLFLTSNVWGYDNIQLECIPLSFFVTSMRIMLTWIVFRFVTIVCYLSTFFLLNSFYFAENSGERYASSQLFRPAAREWRGLYRPFWVAVQSLIHLRYDPRCASPWTVSSASSWRSWRVWRSRGRSWGTGSFSHLTIKIHQVLLWQRILIINEHSIATSF